MRRTTPLRALIGLAVVVLAASGCTADRPENSDTVTIGASLPLTGEFSQGGLDTQHG
ncbi:MAG: branched-chain amino acid transport system substrate-binding protein, partial [Mycobacterium sp.]|nr:branched-chain amino acid transport system substrate-binding protein [Mycobacterium sp.]